MGAIGFTDEHVLHRYTKRLWAWRDRWGRQSWCEAEIGRLACAAGGGGLWPLIADRAA
jgi:acyl-CoA dehydrogenase